MPEQEGITYIPGPDQTKILSELNRRKKVNHWNHEDRFQAESVFFDNRFEITSIPQIQDAGRVI